MCLEIRELQSQTADFLEDLDVEGAESPPDHRLLGYWRDVEESFRVFLIQGSRGGENRVRIQH